ncbi:cupin domain-containing protein [Sphingobacterium sp.]|uniref:cupin domain-containing protein n=1 Tax=Sphingobacterium sp. TaxID=341027 RepID=UPI0031D0D6B0
MIEIINSFERLEEVTKDNIMLQKVAHLTGDNTLSFFIIELDRNQTLPAHYHKAGLEIYYILSGKATIKNALFTLENQLDINTQTATKGDTFCIPPFEIHQITNLDTEVLIILAVAPQSHNNIDRYFIELNDN